MFLLALFNILMTPFAVFFLLLCSVYSIRLVTFKVLLLSRIPILGFLANLTWCISVDQRRSNFRVRNSFVIKWVYSCTTEGRYEVFGRQSFQVRFIGELCNLITSDICTTSRKRLRAKYTPDLHLTYIITRGLVGLK